jgi:hypothetical protein
MYFGERLTDEADFFGISIVKRAVVAAPRSLCVYNG